MALFNKTTLLASALCVSLALAGCKSNSSSSVSSPLDNDEFSIDKDAYATSCVVGATAIGVACLLIADSNNRAWCLAAAAAGCAAFMGGNYLLDELRRGYHTREQQLDALINTISQNNVKASKMAQAALSQYKSDQSTLAKIEGDIKKSQANKGEIQRQIALYDANIKVLNANLESHQTQLTSFKEARDGLIADGSLNANEKQKLKELDQQIAQLQKDIATIQQVASNYIHDRDVLNLAASNMQDGTKV